MADYTEGTKEEINRTALVAILLAGSFLAILNQTLLITATPHIMLDFDLSESTGQWVTTVFMLVNGIMIPITAFLMETYTTRRLFLVSMLIFIVGTIVCLFAINFPLLMAGRVIQASAAGIMLPLMMTIFMLIFPIERRGFAMGMAGLVIAFAPAIGPSLAGWLVEMMHWRFLFLIILPLCIIDMIFAYFFMSNIIKRTFPKVDYPSIVFSIFGFGGILFGFSNVGNYGWVHPYVIISLLVGAVTLTIFILRQLRLDEPILEFRVFQNRTFTLTTIIGMIAFVMLIAAETILPIYMQLMAGFTALESGIMILPGALIMGLMSPIVGKIFDKIGARALLITGLGIVTFTTLFFTNLSQSTSLLYLTVLFGVRMIGIAMVTMPATTAGLNALPIKLMPHGTAMTNTMRQIAASIGTATLVTVMSLGAFGSRHPDALIQGVNIAFYAATAISFIGFILALFVKQIKPADIEN